MPSNPAYSDDDMVTLAVAAKIAGVHPNTLRRYASDGRITSYRTPGRHLRFQVKDIRPEKLVRPAAEAAS